MDKEAQFFFMIVMAGLGLWYVSSLNDISNDPTALPAEADSEEGAFQKLQDYLGTGVAIVTGKITSMSQAGIDFLKSQEGFSATPYSDHKGYSIGYGHLMQSGENLTSVTQDEAEQLLRSDVAAAERTVASAVNVTLTQAQFDALVSFTYNVGGGAFRGSTMLVKINEGNFAGAAAEFQRWIYASGQVSPALVARRGAEAEMFA